MGNRKTSYPISKRLYYRSGRSNKNVSNGVQSDIADEMDTDTEVSLLKYRSMSITNLDKDDSTSRSKINSVTQLSSLEEKMEKIELSLGMKTLNRKLKNGSKFQPNSNAIKIINNVDNNYQRALDEKIQVLQNSIEWQKNNIRKPKIFARNDKDRREDELKLLLDIQELDSLKKLATNTSSHVKNCNGLDSVDLFNCIRGFEYVSLHAVDVLNYSQQNPVFEVEEIFDRRGLWIQWARKDLPLEKNDRIIEVNGIFFIGKDYNDFIEMTKNTSILHLVILRTQILPAQTVNFLTSMSTDRELYDLKTEIGKLKMDASQTNMIKEYLQNENVELTKRLTKLEDQMTVLIDMLKKGLAFKKNSSILLNSLLIKNHTETAREKNSGYFSDYVNYKEKNKKYF